VVERRPRPGLGTAVPADFADFMAAEKNPQLRRSIIISEPGSFYKFRPQGGNGRTAPHLYVRVHDAACGAPYGLNDEHTTAP
jgi:hypothetical protein